MVRQATNKLIDMADEGVISWESVALACLRYFPESDIADMARCEFYIGIDDDDDETDDDDQDETGI